MEMGETRQRIMAKRMINVAGKEEKEACGKEQLCGGMEAGIEGGINTISLLWAKNSQD